LVTEQALLLVPQLISDDFTPPPTIDRRSAHVVHEYPMARWPSRNSSI
jgi:hypothetical protein